MENENKNSAIEKTENIANNNENGLYGESLLKKHERELNAEDRHAKKLKKQALKEQKRTNSAINGKNKRNNSGFITAIVCLSLASIILGGLLVYTVFSPVDDYINYSSQEERNFYELVGHVDGIDTNLSKAIVSNDNEHLQTIFSDVVVQSNMASENLSNLALHDEEKFYTMKFINQVGDYSKYLQNKLIYGEELTEKDYKTLNEIYEINKGLKAELSSLASEIDENFNFSSIYENKQDNLVISKFKDLEKASTEYPHMIYDGAFSDGVDGDLAVALLNEKEVTKLEAEEVFKKAFSSYGISNVELTGETKDKVIETYNFDADLDDGTVISATVSKKGGKIINFNNFRQAENIKYAQVDTLKIAEDFLNSIGLKGMKAVWTTQSESVDTYNFAYYEKDIVHYPDLVKVNVCRERGIVCSMEAKSYYLNHKQRVVGEVKLSNDEAKLKVSSKINVETTRLALIPAGNKEVLAYEFTGEYKGETYYVYINAKTGAEVDIFKVVKTTEGDLLV